MQPLDRVLRRGARRVHLLADHMRVILHRLRLGEGLADRLGEGLRRPAMFLLVVAEEAVVVAVATPVAVAVAGAAAVVEATSRVPLARIC